MFNWQVQTGSEEFLLAKLILIKFAVWWSMIGSSLDISHINFPVFFNSLKFLATGSMLAYNLFLSSQLCLQFVMKCSSSSVSFRVQYWHTLSLGSIYSLLHVNLSDSICRLCAPTLILAIWVLLSLFLMTAVYASHPKFVPSFLVLFWKVSSYHFFPK